MSKYPKVPKSIQKYLKVQFGTVWNSLEQFGTVWNSLKQFGTLRAISGDGTGLDWMVIPEQIGYKITAERC